ncbi:hypothetical protein ONE63_005107 [Megalurothrips usitatus]|uniref:Uncharacterized protein n=1 Tax=Megalurothrips usitatus TaxID=439358 RepID=A0AAV7XXJ7_9NEOP|nr:hypothetical protein ONE63_005107 [Megalurothrips usitatus]
MGVLSEESDESESDQKEEGRDETTTPDSVPVPNLNVQSDQSDDEEDEDESTTHDDMNMQCDEPEGQREEEVEARATDEVPLPIPEVPGLDVLLPCAGGDGDDDVPGDMHSGPDEAEETSFFLELKISERSNVNKDYEELLATPHDRLAVPQFPYGFDGRPLRYKL